MPVKILDVDKGYKKFIQSLKDAKATISVGVHADDGAKPEKGGATVAEIATYHEFGLGVPRRSFLADWVDQNTETIRHTMALFARAVAARKLTSAQSWMQFGLWSVGQIQQRISAGIAPPLEQSTIDRKGSSTPLIDTGQLRASIASRVDVGSDDKS